MNKRNPLLYPALALALLAAYWVVQAGSLEPPGPPGSTMKTLDQVEPRTPLGTSGPLVISAPGSYYLTGNVTSGGNGISVSADNVTIDLRGFSLSGNNLGEGVEVSGRENVVVTNGLIRGFRRGVFVSGADGLRLSRLRIVDNVLSGIFVTNQSSEVKVDDCSVSKNGANGIHVYSGNDAVSTLRPHYIENNTVADNGNTGILASRVLSFVHNNVVTGNDSFGIDVDGGDHSVSGNRVGYNLGSGVRVGAGFVYVVDNSSVGNGDHGFEDASGAGVLIARNLAQFNYGGNYSLTAGSHGITGDVDTDPNGWRSVHR